MSEVESVKTLGFSGDPQKGNVLQFRMEQHPMKGLDIFVKSALLERLFSSLANGATAPYDSDRRMYALSREKMPPIEGFCFDNPKHPLVVPGLGGLGVNLTLLRIVGLSSGVKLSINTPMSQKDFRLFRKKLEEGVTRLYNLYMKPAVFTLEITSKEE